MTRTTPHIQTSLQVPVTGTAEVPLRETRSVVGGGYLERDRPGWSLGGKQRQAPAPGQVPRRNDQKIPPVQGRDLPQVETLGERNDARIHSLQAQRRITGQQLIHPPVAMRGRLDHPQLIRCDRRAELGSKPGAAPTLRVRQQMADLRDGQRRDN